MARSDPDSDTNDPFPPPRNPLPAKAPTENAPWSKAGLDKLISFAETPRSTGVVILADGRIAAEQYRDPARFRATPLLRFEKLPEGRSREDVASAQKSVTAVLFGIARARKLVDFDTTVSNLLGAGWSKLPAEGELGITMHHLFTMTSVAAQGALGRKV